MYGSRATRWLSGGVITMFRNNGSRATDAGRSIRGTGRADVATNDGGARSRTIEPRRSPDECLFLLAPPPGTRAKPLSPGPPPEFFLWATEPLMCVSAQSNNGECVHYPRIDLQTACGAGDYREAKGNQSGYGTATCSGHGTRSGTNSRRQLEDAGISAFRARSR